MDNGVMNEVSRFTLERHGGPYETWPLRSRLFLDGQPTGISVLGYDLLHQYETPDGYVLVTDYDCPFEESTSFSLVSKSLHVLSWRCLWEPYASCWLNRIEWMDDRTFVAVICDGHRYRFRVRSWGIPYIRPRLKMKYLGKL